MTKCFDKKAFNLGDKLFFQLIQACVGHKDVLLLNCELIFVLDDNYSAIPRFKDKKTLMTFSPCIFKWKCLKGQFFPSICIKNPDDNQVFDLQYDKTYFSYYT